MVQNGGFGNHVLANGQDLNTMYPTWTYTEENDTAIHVIEANPDSSTGEHAKPDSYQCHGWFFKPELQTEEACPYKAFFVDDGPYFGLHLVEKHPSMMSFISYDS